MAARIGSQREFPTLQAMRPALGRRRGWTTRIPIETRRWTADPRACSEFCRDHLATLCLPLRRGTRVPEEACRAIIDNYLMPDVRHIEFLRNG
jgi:hypothetical protein